MRGKYPILASRRADHFLAQLSKTALIDLVWSFASRCAGGATSIEEDEELTMRELKSEVEIICTHRCDRLPKEMKPSEVKP